MRSNSTESNGLVFEPSVIAEGLMIGIGVWVVTLIYLFVTEVRKRAEERKYLRTLLKKQLDAIMDAQSITTPSGQVIQADVIRKTIYEELSSDVQEILDRGASHLPFDDKMKLRKIFRLMNWAMNAGGIERTPDVRVYETNLVGKLRKISWLRKM